MSEVKSYDVAIVGGGPGGSTCGAFLRKYNPEISVAIFEREKFPRDHVGESQLPIISRYLDELGVWEKVEAANFPIKIGATYRWGSSDDLWDFNFVPNGELASEQRPGKYDGQRKLTAFQVDRAVYDEILLNHAEELGCQVFQETSVRSVELNGDRIEGLNLGDGTRVEAKHYIDATGHVGFLRRQLGVEVQEPSSLKNIAIWDYWQNAEWAVNIGVGGTRVQVMSLGFGWIWFIPLSPTRTSIGLVCPAEHYKKTGLKPEELYLQALASEPRISALTKSATRENLLQTTKDWSFYADRMVGENWFLVGEAAGFADPVLAAGLSLTHASARDAAFTINDLGKGRDAWLKEQYETRNKRKVQQHIRFADYWYTANGHFTELKEFTREIAATAGLELTADAAFQWLGTGGFVEEDMGFGGLALFSLDSLHFIAGKLGEAPEKSIIDGYNCFLLDLKGAEQKDQAVYEMGHVHAIPSFTRNGKTFPLVGLFGWIYAGLKFSPRVDLAFNHIRIGLAQNGVQYDEGMHSRLIQTLEALAHDGWIKCKKVEDGPDFRVVYQQDNELIGRNRDEEIRPDKIAASLRAQ